MASNWLNWMTDKFLPAVEPPPVQPSPPTAPVAPPPVQTGHEEYPPYAPGITPEPGLPPSPVPGCDDKTWADYEALLALREGEKYVVYYDSLGKPTGGIGHLLLPSDGLKVGAKIDPATVKRWFTHDGATAMDAAVSQCKLAGITSQAFLPYLASVNYQLGIRWNQKFPNTWKMIVAGQYAQAASALVGTIWQKQTAVRTNDFQKALRALPPKAAA